jgi:hypothetical protein
MRRGMVALSSVIVVGGAGDPAEFRPAKSAAREYPAAKDAYRVQEVPGAECEPIGVVHADGMDPIEKIAITAARHGGTHYIVRGDFENPEVVTNHQAHRVGNAMFATSTSRVERNRKLWAQVYRCGGE